MTRPHPASRERAHFPAELGYVRDSDTPVVFTDVIEALESLADLAERSGDRDVAVAARHVHAMATTIRGQFVADLTGPASPSETAIALDRRRAHREPPAGAGPGWRQAAR